MIFKTLLIFSLCLYTILSIRLRVSVNRNEGQVCFYESLRKSAITIEKDQKYLFKIEADTPNYRMDIMTQDPQQSNGWKEVATKMAKRVTESINKISETAGTYTFCISSSQQRIIKATVEIQCKLQLANFDYLPSLDDHQNMSREIEWMQKQKQKLLEILNRMEGIRSSSEQLKSMMGVSMVVVAIVGVFIIAGVNFIFYTLAKKTLKDRKLI